MKIRWMILFFPVVSVVVISMLVKEHGAKASSPQAIAAPVSKSAAVAAASNNSGSLDDSRYHAGHQFAKAHVGAGGALRDQCEV